MAPQIQLKDHLALTVVPEDELAAIEELFDQLESSQHAFVLELEQAERTCAALSETLAAHAEALQEAEAARDAEKEQKQLVLEEVELTQLQLAQMQEELEHYFLNAQSAEQLALSQHEQLLRAQALMARMLPEAVAKPLDQG